VATRQREEVLNVVLAERIAGRGMLADPETIISSNTRKRALPDVIVNIRAVCQARCGSMGREEER
jgi:hypothetical protein